MLVPRTGERRRTERNKSIERQESMLPLVRQTKPTLGSREGLAGIRGRWRMDR